MDFSIGKGHRTSLPINCLVYTFLKVVNHSAGVLSKSLE